MAAELLARFDEFTEKIAESDKIALAHHSDADGFGSGLIVEKALEKLRGKRADTRFIPPVHEYFLSGKTLGEFREKGIQKLVSVDLGLDARPQAFLEEEKSFSSLILDHHKLCEDLNSRNTIMLKPQLLLYSCEPSKYPCAKFVFDLFSRHADLKEFNWLSVLGIVGDNSVENYPEEIEIAEKEHSLSVRDFQELADLIDAVGAADFGNLYSLYEEFFTAEKPRDLFESSFFSFKKEFDREVEEWGNRFKTEAERFEKEELNLFTIKPEFSIKSPLSNRLSKLEPGKILVIAEDLRDGFLYLSARRQDFRVKVNDLLQDAVEGFGEGNAGGHIPAAGGKILKKDFPAFRERLLSAAPKKGFRINPAQKTGKMR